MKTAKKPADKGSVAEAIRVVLGSSYTLLIKTHGFHWNVTGEMFNTLHVMFEEQYTDLFAAVDEQAERIRAINEFAPGSMSELGKYSLIKDTKGVPAPKNMIAELQKDHETLAAACQKGVEVAQAAGDELTADLFIQRGTTHEKTAWMLRSLLA